MKYILLLMILSACGNNHNLLMTELINKKSAIQDSLDVAKGSQSMWEDSAKAVNHRTGDTLQYKPLIDSEMFYFSRQMTLAKRLDEIRFSIDSLDKMK